MDYYPSEITGRSTYTHSKSVIPPLKKTTLSIEKCIVQLKVVFFGGWVGKI
jgi:hypothetical protein